MMLLLIAFFLFVLLVLWMRYFEPKRYQINKHFVQTSKPLSRPVQILHLSDTHFSKPKTHLADFFKQLAKTTYDFVFITGDIIDCREGIPLCVEYLREIKTNYGIYAVLGNHDYYDYSLIDCLTRNFQGQKHPLRRNSWLGLKQALESIGVYVLKNQTLKIDVQGSPFFIHGVDDSTTGHADLTKINPQYGPCNINVLLTHTVDVFFGLPSHEIDLSFSGHSHGGQVRLPLIGAILTHTRAGRKYVEGVRKFMGATCCISRGLDSSRFLPFRLLCRPEAILLTLQNKK